MLSSAESEGRVDSVIVSLLLRCKLRERLRFIDTCPPREQVHIFVRPNQSPEFSMSDLTILSTKTEGSCWQVSVDVV